MKQFLLRMPDELHDSLVTAKGSSRRSVNAEIVFRLERSFGDAALTEPEACVRPRNDGGPRAATTTASDDPVSHAGSGSVSASRPRTKMCEHRIPADSYCATCDRVSL